MSDGTWSPTTTTLKDKTCKCCGGDGTQLNTLTGLRVLCPCCGGTGRRVETGPTFEVVS